MQDLIQSVKNSFDENKQLPFAVYSSVKEQKILNVPVAKPLLIFILGGMKKLGDENDVICPAGNFVFLSNNPNIDMRNIPDHEEYLAVLIEFDYSDFEQFKDKPRRTKKYFKGEICPVLKNTLHQYVEWSTFAPTEAWHFRKQELLQIIFQSGYEDVITIAEPPSLTHQLQDIINKNIAADWGVDRLASELAVSESTLRRKLTAEGTSIQQIRNRIKLGHGLHLIQTTMEPIGRIAEQCGYHSQSRFTDKFKQLFGVTPRELRKTRMTD